ncbi:MAG: FG-GAP repeat protein, partial [Armatimonadetes bacterium]|nr:FG-GAP repeat protein [Akkermansiaceae bacterium]
YVFTRNGTAWTQQAYLKSSNYGVDDYFGRSVAVSGGTVVIGALGEASNATGVNGNQADSATNSGAAYIFTGLGPAATSFVSWAANNIPVGQNAAFDADWNRDGIPNGVAYLFGTTRFNTTGRGRFPAPPAIPADVDLHLERSTTLVSGWSPVASWVNSAAPTFASGVSIVNGEVRDTFAGPSAYYRYRVELR